MATTASRATVAAPVETVWEALASFADISRWSRTVAQSSLLTVGPPGPGVTRRVQVGRSALRETIDEWNKQPLRSTVLDNLARLTSSLQ